MMSGGKEFDLATSFQESIEESEKTSIGKALELIPADGDETVPEQYLNRYDCLLQQTINKAFVQRASTYFNSLDQKSGMHFVPLCLFCHHD